MKSSARTFFSSLRFFLFSLACTFLLCSCDLGFVTFDTGSAAPQLDAPPLIGPPVQLIVAVPSTSLVLGLCSSGIQIITKDAHGEETSVSSDKTIYLNGAGNGQFFADPNCQYAIGTSTMVTRGSHSKTIYFRDNFEETLQLGATVPGIGSAVTQIGIVRTVTQLNLSGPSATGAGICSAAFQLSRVDGTGAAFDDAAPTPVRLVGGSGKFFSDATCSQPITTLDVGPVPATRTFYYMSGRPETVALLANSSGMISGLQKAKTLTLTFSSAPPSLTLGACSAAMQVNTVDEKGAVVAPATDFAFNLGSDAASASFYADSGCTKPLSGNQLTIPAGTSGGTFYVKITGAPRAGGAMVALSTSAGIAQLATQQMAAMRDARQITIQAPFSTVTATQCSGPFEAVVQDGIGGNFDLSAPLTVSLSANPPGGTFYSDAGCLNPQTQVQIPANSHQASFYFQSSFVAANAPGAIVPQASVPGGGNQFSLNLQREALTLDPVFGKNGKLTSAQGTSSAIFAAAMQGVKIVVAGTITLAGTQDFFLARFNPDGSLDTSFGSNGTGTVATPFGASARGYAIGIDPQRGGNIYVVGAAGSGSSQQVAFASYSANGVLITTNTVSFGGQDAGRALAVESSGNILVAGESIGTSSSDFAVARLTPGGAVQTLFGTNGHFNFGTTTAPNQDSAYAATLDASGNFVVVGSDTVAGKTSFAIARFSSAGTLNGLATTGFGGVDAASAVAIDPVSGGILVAGSSSNRVALARYSPTAAVTTNILSLDSGFANGPTGVGSGTSLSLALQADGRPVVAGAFGNNFLLARFTSGGSLEGSVTTSLNNSDSASACLIQQDGKIVLAGISNGQIALARYFR